MKAKELKPEMSIIDTAGKGLLVIETVTLSKNTVAVRYYGIRSNDEFSPDDEIEVLKEEEG